MERIGRPAERDDAHAWASQDKRQHQPETVLATMASAVALLALAALFTSVPARAAAASAAAALARTRAQAPWHFLNFLPDPHQQGSLRPIVSSSESTRCSTGGGSSSPS